MASPIFRALRGRCPRCGRGPLYSGFLKIRDKCEVCGLDLRGHDAGDGPAVISTFFTGSITVGVVVWIELAFQPPFWVHFSVAILVVILSALLLLRPLKSLFVGAQYKYRSTHKDTESQ